MCSASDSATAGAALAEQLCAQGLRAVFVLSDGLQVNGSELVRGLLAGVSPDVTVTGGLAGDGDRFERTWVLDDGMLRTGRVSAVGFYGDTIRVGHGSRGGWDIFGPERVVTRSAGNVLYELDGKPALSVYKRYLGALAEELPASALLFPLAVRAAQDDDQLVRTVLAVDDADQSMTFAGDVPEGSRAQLMRSSPDRLVDGAAGAGDAAANAQAGGGPLLGSRSLVSGDVWYWVSGLSRRSKPPTTRSARCRAGRLLLVRRDRTRWERLLRSAQSDDDGDHPCRTLTRTDSRPSRIE